MLRPSLPTLLDISIETRIADDEGHNGPLGSVPRASRKWLAKTQLKQSKLVIWVGLGCDLRRGDEWGALDNALMRSPEDWPALR